MEKVRIPTSIRDNNVLEQKVFDVFQEIGVDICDSDIQVCHHLTDKHQIIKFNKRKACLQILRVKRQLIALDPAAAIDLQKGSKIFINEFVPLLSGDTGQMQTVRGQTKSAPVLYNKWFNSPIWLTYRICFPILTSMVSSYFSPDICW